MFEYTEIISAIVAALTDYQLYGCSREAKGLSHAVFNVSLVCFSPQAQPRGRRAQDQD